MAERACEALHTESTRTSSAFTRTACDAVPRRAHEQLAPRRFRCCCVLAFGQLKPLNSARARVRRRRLNASLSPLAAQAPRVAPLPLRPALPHHHRQGRLRPVNRRIALALHLPGRRAPLITAAAGLLAAIGATLRSPRLRPPRRPTHWCRLAGHSALSPLRCRSIGSAPNPEGGAPPAALHGLSLAALAGDAVMEKPPPTPSTDQITITLHRLSRRRPNLLAPRYRRHARDDQPHHEEAFKKLLEPYGYIVDEAFYEAEVTKVDADVFKKLLPEGTSEAELLAMSKKKDDLFCELYREFCATATYVQAAQHSKTAAAQAAQPSSTAEPCQCPLTPSSFLPTSTVWPTDNTWAGGGLGGREAEWRQMHRCDERTARCGGGVHPVAA